MPATRFAYFLTIGTVLVGASIGCGKGGATQLAASGNADASYSAAEAYASLLKQSASPAFLSDVQTLRTAAWSDLDSAAAASGDKLLSINGISPGHFAADSQGSADLANFATKYSTVGAAFAHVGFTDLQTVTVADVAQGFDVFRKMANGESSFSSSEQAAAAKAFVAAMALPNGLQAKGGASLALNDNSCDGGFKCTMRLWGHALECGFTLGIHCPGSGDGSTDSNGNTRDAGGNVRTQSGTLVPPPIQCGPSANGARSNICDSSSGINTAHGIITGVNQP